MWLPAIDSDREAHYVKYRGKCNNMPGINRVQKIQIPTSYAKSEIKGRDFYTQSGKSERMSVLTSKNVPTQPASFNRRSTPPTGTFLVTALGVSAMANIAQANAGTQPLTNTLKSSQKNLSLSSHLHSAPRHPPVHLNTSFKLPKNHSTISKKVIASTKLSDFSPELKALVNFSQNLHSSQRPAENKARNVEGNARRIRPTDSKDARNFSTKASHSRRVERSRTKRQQLDRDVKAIKNSGDEQYWMPITPLPEISPPTIDHQNYRKKKQWHKPLGEVISYLQDSSQIAYPSLASNRLDAARLAYGMTDLANWQDEDVFNFANQQIDPANANYSLPMARELIRYEALLYYVQYRAIDWDLNLSDFYFERDFLNAHEVHHGAFNAETVVKFYNNQFHHLHRLSAEPFKTRNESGSLEKYYAQFNHYLKSHASDDAVNAAELIAAFREISKLDLERRFTPLFSLRVGHYQKELLPQTAYSVETLKLGAFIYILQGDSGKRYAASMWGSILMVADMSDILSKEKTENISAIRNNGIVPPESLEVGALLAALWPESPDFFAGKSAVIVKFQRQVELSSQQPVLSEVLVHLQLRAIKVFINSWRDQHINKNGLEKFLSFVPFFDVIQRKLHHPHYQPTLKDLAFDLFDLGITLLTLGIPLVKLGSTGIKAALIAVKTARLAGLTGTALRKAVFNAVKPTLKNMARVSGHEIAGFVVPPYDLLRLLHKPLKKGIRNIAQTRHSKGLRRCVRAIGGACVPRTESIHGFNTADWDGLLTHLIMDPASWKGATMTRAYRHEYFRRFTALSADQKEALRGWSYVPKQKDYRNYPRKRSWPAGKSNINFMLNQSLSCGYPSPGMLRIAHHLSSAIKALPSVPDSQSLLRVVDISEDNISLFRAGDVVSNYPAFMSASSKGKLANIALSQGWLFDPSWRARANSAIAIYHITGDKSRPLINRLTTQIDMEGEYLFDQRSVFKIEAITRLFLTSPVRSFKQIYFIKLVEIPGEGPRWVKNIFTANDILI